MAKNSKTYKEAMHEFCEETNWILSEMQRKDQVETHDIVKDTFTKIWLIEKENE